MAEKKLVIEQIEDVPGVTIAFHDCPPHVWYYANLLHQWKCSFCGKLTHEKPTDGILTEEVEYKTVTPEEAESIVTRTIRLPLKIAYRLRRVAEEKGKSLNEFICEILSSEAERQKSANIG